MSENLIKNIEKLKNSFFLLSIILLPLNDTLQIFSFSITLFFSLITYYFNHHENNTKSLWVLLPSILLIISILSLLYTPDIGSGIQKIEKNLALILVPACFFFGNFSEQHLQKAKKGFLYSWVLFCIVSLLFLGYNWLELADQRHFYNFIQTSMYHNYMPQDAMYINTAFVFLLFSKTNPTLKILLSFLFLSVLLLFGVRLGLMIFLIIFLFYMITNFKKLINFKNIILLSLLIFIGVFLINSNPYTKDKFYDSLSKLGIPQTSEEVSNIGEAYHNISLRTQIWETSFELIKEKPILGYGVGMEKKILFERNEDKQYDIPMFHSHNQFLSITIQYGIVGLFFFLFILSVLIIKSLKNLHHILICLILISSMITDSYLDVQQGIIYFSFFASLILANKRNSIKKIDG